MVIKWSKDFLTKLRIADEALSACQIHEEAGPGYKGLRENLWQIAHFPSERIFLRAIYPGYPNHYPNLQSIKNFEMTEDEWQAEYEKDNAYIKGLRNG